MVVSLVLGLASASPTVTQEDANTVIGEVVVNAPVEAVRKRVGDAEWLEAVDPSDTTAVVASRDGDCTVVDHASPNAFRTVRYRIRRCPTDDGVAATLVSSDTLDAFAYAWRITEDDAGTHIAYELTVDVGMAPRFIVNRETRKSVDALLRQIESAFDG